MHHLVGRAGFVVDVFFAKVDREVVDNLGLLENREGAVATNGIHNSHYNCYKNNNNYIEIRGGGGTACGFGEKKMNSEIRKNRESQKKISYSPAQTRKLYFTTWRMTNHSPGFFVVSRLTP